MTVSYTHLDVDKRQEISDSLREILRYMNDPKNYPVEETGLPLIRSIDEAVGEAKMSDEWRHAYMIYQVHQQDAELRGIAIGEARGIAIGEERGEKPVSYTHLDVYKRQLLHGLCFPPVGRPCRRVFAYDVRNYITVYISFQVFCSLHSRCRVL